MEGRKVMNAPNEIFKPSESVGGGSKQKRQEEQGRKIKRKEAMLANLKAEHKKDSGHTSRSSGKMRTRIGGTWRNLKRQVTHIVGPNSMHCCQTARKTHRQCWHFYLRISAKA